MDTCNTEVDLLHRCIMELPDDLFTKFISDLRFTLYEKANVDCKEVSIKRKHIYTLDTRSHLIYQGKKKVVPLKYKNKNFFR